MIKVIYQVRLQCDRCSNWANMEMVVPLNEPPSREYAQFPKNWGYRSVTVTPRWAGETLWKHELCCPECNK